MAGVSRGSVAHGHNHGHTRSLEGPELAWRDSGRWGALGAGGEGKAQPVVMLTHQGAEHPGARVPLFGDRRVPLARDGESAVLARRARVSGGGAASMSGGAAALHAECFGSIPRVG